MSPKDEDTVANSVDPDQEQSDWGLHYLPRPVCLKTKDHHGHHYRNLGEKTSFIELDTPTMTPEQMSELETALNQKIRDCIAVMPILYHDKNDPELLKVSYFKTPKYLDT